MISQSNDTIVAISTPHGRSGIGVIRLSGLSALTISKKIFRKKKTKAGEKFVSHKAYYGEIFEPVSNEKIDEAMMVFMKEPKSYTCENMIELSLHGSPIVLEETLKRLIEEGARLAEPGEFTKRAYLNKRIDLIQAEAVSELINSKSLLETKFVMKRVGGELSNFIENIQTEILKLLSEFEASVDFPEDDLEFESNDDRKIKFENISKKLENLIKSYESTQAMSRGISAAIVGVTNAGKSTLFNSLLKRNRAIVSDKPGTTRDYLYDEIEFEGMLFKLFDTAGLNIDSQDGIEREGIEKTFDIIDKSDLLLIVLEKGKRFSDEEKTIIQRANGKEKLVILNKIDLPGENVEKDINDYDHIEVSALKNIHLDALEKKIADKFKAKIEDFSEAMSISSFRQKKALEETIASFNKAQKSFFDRMSPEFIAFDLKSAYQNLLGFSGKNSIDIGEEILENIFSNFCIGK